MTKEVPFVEGVTDRWFGNIPLGGAHHLSPFSGMFRVPRRSMIDPSLENVKCTDPNGHSAALSPADRSDPHANETEQLGFHGWKDSNPRPLLGMTSRHSFSVWGSEV
jgi:hypothetical protein